MEATLEFPPIVGDSLTTGIVPKVAALPSIRDAVLAQFKDAEVTVRTIADKYRDVAFAVGTPQGMRDAIAARADCRENGRLALTRAEKRIKADVNDLKRVMAEEVTRLVAIVEPVEEAIGAQIKAEEDRKEAEREVRRQAERAEAQRIADHEARLSQFADYVSQANGKGTEALDRAITAVGTITIDPEAWQEFTDRAIAAKNATLDAFAAMRVTAAKAEADAAELEALRAEKAERDRIADAERAELARQQAELQLRASLIAAFDVAIGRVGYERAKAMLDAYDSDGCGVLSTEIDDCITALGELQPSASNATDTPAHDSQLVLKAEPETADATDRETHASTSPVGGPLGVGKPAAAGPAGDLLLQDQCRGLTDALASKPDAMFHAREAAAQIAVERSEEASRVILMEVEPEDATQQLLRDAFELTRYCAAPFSGKFPAHPKPSQDWWAGLRAYLERLQPLLEDAIHEGSL